MIGLPGLVDLVAVVLVVEVIALFAWGRRIGLPPPRKLLPNLAAGFFLVLALRTVVHAERVEATALFLALAGIVHVMDLRTRMRPGR